MSIIVTVPESEAAGPVAELYADDVDAQGYVAAHTKVLGLNPGALLAWNELSRAITVQMDRRRYELVTLAAARGARSAHCLLAHGRVASRYLSEEQLIRLARGDLRGAGLTPAEVAMMEFAERVSRDAADMTEADGLRLREAGFTDREIVDIALAAAARNFYSRAVQALAVEVEPPADVSAELRAALVDGL
ncbi:carboxymuconolactone decarboxylase family protein [Rathayibacter sp. VKM Ac-2803]|uniref:carboxymuconolactone decarboxylase family protein n=1 Tax=unclassified Rathayibacter TaxID=2609250 RepID=UPI001359DF9E|nr:MULTISPECIES: carboxymuconolactone decarboxylase family protein [unclassified Rathayibacter]MWV51331.1 carboxymuconolactone decarboxylase family protein [Rathayibacter sp. VKM Ac-2803]MWV57806.1 carboxymuconolactone decarboxylase family protein [Rathayibacter sp. VKM Ac-2754]